VARLVVLVCAVGLLVALAGAAAGLGWVALGLTDVIGEDSGATLAS